MVNRGRPKLYHEGAPIRVIFVGMSTFAGLFNTKVSFFFLQAITWFHITKDNNHEKFGIKILEIYIQID